MFRTPAQLSLAHRCRQGLPLTIRVRSHRSEALRLSSAAHAPKCVNGALALSMRYFYSGLDDSRVSRLRRSGITFNKPRGRDSMSLAFEKRIHLRPYAGADIYTALALSEVGDPASYGSGKGSVGVVGVVDPMVVDDVQKPLVLPSQHHPYNDMFNRLAKVEYEDDNASLETHRQHRISKKLPSVTTDEMGYMPLKYILEERLAAAQTESRNVAQLGDGRDSVATSDDKGAAIVKHDSIDSLADASAFVLPSSHRRHLQKSGDTTCVCGQLPPIRPKSTTTHFFTIPCIEPVIDVELYRREEAQVEMITAYRNILLEAADYRLPLGAGGFGKGGAANPQVIPRNNNNYSQPYAAGRQALEEEAKRLNIETRLGPVDVLRIPALCVHTCGPNFRADIAKLNQQSLIKGFHRISNEAREILLGNPNFKIEIYVPVELMPKFESVFLEDAWETPTSTLNPGRTALYPGLAPPRTLLEYDGWVGKRPELVEAIESGGKNLMRGTRYNLDGTPVEPQEVLSGMSVFGVEDTTKKRVALERATALLSSSTEANTSSNDEAAGARVPGIGSEEGGESPKHVDTDYFGDVSKSLEAGLPRRK